MDFNIHGDIVSSCLRLNELFKKRILWDESSFYRKSAITEIFVLLRDLLYKSEHYCGARISFKDDILIDDKIKDITALIRYFRNGICHIDSENRNLDPYIKFSFLYFNGITSVNLNGVTIHTKYTDDIGFIMGHQVIYIKRHLERAFKEVIDVFLSQNVFPESLLK